MLIVPRSSMVALPPRSGGVPRARILVQEHNRRPHGLLDGKIGLIVGIANDRSYAWHIAKSMRENGARCVYSHLPGEKNERRTRRAVEEFGEADPWMVPLDAGAG